MTRRAGGPPRAHPIAAIAARTLLVVAVLTLAAATLLPTRSLAGPPDASSPPSTTVSTPTADGDGATAGDGASEPLAGYSEDDLRRLFATVQACGSEPGWVCTRVFEWTGNDALSEGAQWFVDVPLRIALVVLAAIVGNRLVRAAIDRYLRRLNARSIAARRDDPAKPVRSTLRMATASSTIANALSVLIAVVATFVVLGELGVSLGPLLAGAGVAGIAIGFGAQNLVRDILAGLFVLIEDQYGVGDVIDAGRAQGTVEEFTLRVTKVRDVEGTLWFVPNGVIAEVGNKTQLWSRAIIDVSVAYDADHELAGRIIKDTADVLWREQRPGARIIEEPELWGVEQLADSGVVIRVAVKSAPADQWAVGRAVRSEVKKALDQAGIEIPIPQQAIWVRSG